MAIDPRFISLFPLACASARSLDDEPSYPTVACLVRLVPYLTSRQSSARYDPFVHRGTLGTATSDLFLLWNSDPGWDQTQKQRVPDRQR